MHQISGWPDIRPDNPAFFDIRPDTGYCNRISGYKKAGYPAKYAAKEKLLNTTYNILQ